MTEIIIVSQNGDKLIDLVNIAFEINKIDKVRYTLIKFNGVKLFVTKDSTLESVEKDLNNHGSKQQA